MLLCLPISAQEEEEESEEEEEICDRMGHLIDGAGREETSKGFFSPSPPCPDRKPASFRS